VRGLTAGVAPVRTGYRLQKARSPSAAATEAVLSPARARPAAAPMAVADAWAGRPGLAVCRHNTGAEIRFVWRPLEAAIIHCELRRRARSRCSVFASSSAASRHAVHTRAALPRSGTLRPAKIRLSSSIPKSIVRALHPHGRQLVRLRNDCEAWAEPGPRDVSASAGV